ncbi:MAG: ATP-binding protein [Gammaproteobacteria bacterium]|nr:ATP-binding protein [Gammaproteobacteria bacterium]
MPDCEIYVISDGDLLVKALTALFKTAVRLSEDGGVVDINCALTGDDAAIGIHTAGPAIPEELVPRFFEVYSVVNPITSQGDLGLEPPVAERIISLFGGTVRVENRKPSGVSFTVKLKTADPSADAENVQI